MSKLRFEGLLTLFVRHADASRSSGMRSEILKIPFQTFETDGTAAKSIVLKTADEQQIVGALEQTISNKNITVNARQGSSVPVSKLIGLAKAEQKDFTTHFAILIYKGESLLRAIGVLTTSGFAETPIPVGSTPAQLKMKFAIKSIDAYRGVLDKKTALLYSVTELQFA